MSPKPAPFVWPQGRRAALSLTWDDARASQLTTGLPILNAHQIRSTFYILPDAVVPHLDEWRRVAGQGHEMGNHTVTHPCSGNHPLFRDRALEDYTLDRMEQEIIEASRRIEASLGTTPESFAYPCAQTFVGRGADVASFVPLVAKRFVVGRGAFQSTCNDPAFCDLAQVFCPSMDERPFEYVVPLLTETLARGGWLVLVGHEIGDRGELTTPSATLEKICAFAARYRNDLWVDTVSTIGKYIRDGRRALRGSAPHPDNPA